MNGLDLPPSGILMHVHLRCTETVIVNLNYFCN
uniref:Uncharacterized protein n=1 Tax=Anguilla anguilla TaxID=7936 RepID=A0A0E9R9C2_ANGAN